MKKKILLILLTLLIITGCTNKGPINNGNGGNINENDKLIINDYDLTLNENGTFDIISFKYPHMASISSLITSEMIVYYKKASLEPLIRVLMGKMEHVSMEDAMKGLTKKETKTINGIDWEVYIDKDNHNNYAYKKDYDVFVIGFIYEDDYSKFEEEFMKTVWLNK